MRRTGRSGRPSSGCVEGGCTARRRALLYCLCPPIAREGPAMQGKDATMALTVLTVRTYKRACSTPFGPSWGCARGSKLGDHPGWQAKQHTHTHACVSCLFRTEAASLGCLGDRGLLCADMPRTSGYP